jgi:carboxyl-terminal processing protease
MRLNKNVITTLTLGAVLGFTASFSLNLIAESHQDSPILPLKELQKFSEVYGRIKQDYVEKVDDKELITDAIRGMLTGLDPHSAYLDADEFKELQVGTSGEFGGLGIEVGMEDGFVKVIAPIDDTPAQKAGLEAGDLIIRLDEKPVKGMTLMDAVKIMRGKPKSPIELTIVREGKDKPFKVTIIRDIIKVKSVKYRLLEPGYAYLRVSSFQSRTTSSVLDAIKALKEENKKEHDKPLKGMVLDLRNNPGGVLHAAVGVSDAFLNDGKIVYTDGRVEDSKMKYFAKDGDVLGNAPLVVLVNQGSASASEIVSGALQDHKRALIVGRKTFGKGSVQTVLPLDETTAVKLTTARYFTPNGRSIQAEGIVPDIEIEPLTVSKNGDDDDFGDISEANLQGHLDNPDDNGNDDKEKPQDKANDKNEEKDNNDVKDEEKTDDNADNASDKKKKEQKLAEEDYELYEALNVLKSMSLIQSRMEKE